MNQKNEETSIPARVQAALRYLHYCDSVTTTCDAAMPARDLTPAEVGVQKAALDVLRLYFVGEMDFGDAPPVSLGRDDEDGEPPVPAIV